MFSGFLPKAATVKTVVAADGNPPPSSAAAKPPGAPNFSGFSAEKPLRCKTVRSGGWQSAAVS